ncbi:hypothetical protein A9R05_45340 (plasmid) [Burkholderia sp. KK1]|nr:hypothetical protein A9R05_45340 [Burkholderia sp. KK1]
MTNETLNRIRTQAISSDTELYNRSETGQLSTRLGFVGDFLRTVNIILIQQNLVTQDQASVIDALDALPVKLQRRALEADYQAIVNSYRTYFHHNLTPLLIRTIELTTEKAPQFQTGLDDELRSVDPAKYYSSFGDEFGKALNQLRTTSNAYFVVLSLGFLALTISSPTTAPSESVILDHIDAAIEVLRRKLLDTLVPDGRVKGSLLLATLISPRDDRFSRYLPYCEKYSDATGFQTLISHANDAQYPGDGVSISHCEPSKQHALLADTLIELIDCFQSLRDARLSYSPGNTGDSGGTPAVHDAAPVPPIAPA